MKTKIIILTSVVLNIALTIWIIINHHKEDFIMVNQSENKILNTKGPAKFSFSSFSLFATPEFQTDCNDNQYIAYVGLFAGNSNGYQPIILISEDIDSKGNLLGRIDTFQTERWRGIIDIKLGEKSDKIVYGKYLFQMEGVEKLTQLDFKLDFNNNCN
jgi:hypothetical protein